jgi:hypothetical protein
LHSDSQYVVRAINEGWVQRWRSNGWMRTRKERAANHDLWEQVVVQVDVHDVEFRWVKGHVGIAENERCDELATEAMQQPDLPEDEGYDPPPQQPRLSLAATSAGDVKAVGATGNGKVTEEGQPCRRCGTPVERRVPKRKRRAEQEYYYEYYLYCPACKAMYMVEAAKRYT